MHREHQGNFWLYIILRVNNANCIHELMCQKPFVKFKYQTFCNINALVFHIFAYNFPIFLGDHGQNSNAFISFVQHVKLFLEVEGNIVHLCGGHNVPNYQQCIIFKLHEIHKTMELVLWKMVFKVHIKVVEIKLSQLHSSHKITMKQYLF
jgi:hypothetical protein